MSSIPVSDKSSIAGAAYNPSSRASSNPNSTSTNKTPTRPTPNEAQRKAQLVDDFKNNIERAKSIGSIAFVEPVFNNVTRKNAEANYHYSFHLMKEAAKPVATFYTSENPETQLFFNSIKAREIDADHKKAYDPKGQLITKIENGVSVPRPYDVKDDVIYGLNHTIPSDENIKSPQEYGKDIGKTISQNTKGVQFVFLGELHSDTNQWDALIGLLEGFKEAKETRPIVIVNEMDPNDPMSGTYALDMWNILKPSERKLLAGDLGDLYAQSKGLADAQADSDFFRSRLENRAVGAVSNWRMVPYAHFLNYASYINPDIKVYNIDLNQSYSYKPDIENRDTQMARAVFLMQKVYPNAIFVSTMGYHHSTQYMENIQTYTYVAPNAPKYLSPQPLENNIVDRINMNTPMAEQLSLLFGPWNVHSIRVYNKNKNVNFFKEDGVIGRDAKFDPISYSEYVKHFDAIIPTLGSGHGKWKNDEWNPPWKQELDKIKGVVKPTLELAANPGTTPVTEK